jgi:hypothetical protein
VHPDVAMLSVAGRAFKSHAAGSSRYVVGQASNAAGVHSPAAR